MTIESTSASATGRAAVPREVPVLTTLIVAGVAIVTALVVSRGLTNLIAETQPEVVVSLGVPSPEALVRLAEKERAPQPDASADVGAAGQVAETPQPDIGAAWRIALRALRAKPFSARTLRMLGQIAEQRADEGAASMLMNAAVKRSIRDPLADIWLANYDLARKNYPSALTRIDALLRTNPNMATTTLPVLVSVASTPEASDALVGVLSRDPPWRSGFLSALPGRVRQADILDDLYLKLMSMRPPLPNEELKPYLDTLIRENFVEQAYYLWTKTLPSDRLTDLGYLFNGDFQTQSSGLPFDWVLDPIQGAKAEIKTYPKDDQRRALSVEFGAGGRVPFQNVTQMTLIPPGHYRLSGEYRADQLTNRRGMTWRLYCAESGTMVAETPRVSGTTDGWDPFEVSFDIPDQDCRAQWLRLELAYRVDIEQEVSGTVWYDNMSVEHIPVGSVDAPADPSKMRIKMPTAASNFEQAIQKPK